MTSICGAQMSNPFALELFILLSAALLFSAIGLVLQTMMARATDLRIYQAITALETAVQIDPAVATRVQIDAAFSAGLQAQQILSRGG